MNPRRIIISAALGFLVAGGSVGCSGLDRELWVKYEAPRPDNASNTNTMYSQVFVTSTGKTHYARVDSSESRLYACAGYLLSKYGQSRARVIDRIFLLPQIQKWLRESAASNQSVEETIKRTGVNVTGCARKQDLILYRIALWKMHSPKEVSTKGFTIPGVPWSSVAAYCVILYYCNADSAAFIYIEDRDSTSEYRVTQTYMDAQGQNVYYTTKTGAAMRYHIADRSVTQLPYGDSPIVPINSPALLVGSRSDSTVTLLDSSGHMTGQLRAFLESALCDACALDSCHFVVAIRDWNYVYDMPWMKVYLLDFRTHAATCLFDAAPGEVFEADWVDRRRPPPEIKAAR